MNCTTVLSTHNQVKDSRTDRRLTPEVPPANEQLLVVNSEGRRSHFSGLQPLVCCPAFSNRHTATHMQANLLQFCVFKKQAMKVVEGLGKIGFEGNGRVVREGTWG